MFWLAWLAGNTTMWMNDISSMAYGPAHREPGDGGAGAGLGEPAAVPVGPPIGALADLVDRKRLYAFAQLWIAGGGATALAVLAAGGC